MVKQSREELIPLNFFAVPYNASKFYISLFLETPFALSQFSLTSRENQMSPLSSLSGLLIYILFLPVTSSSWFFSPCSVTSTKFNFFYVSEKLRTLILGDSKRFIRTYLYLRDITWKLIFLQGSNIHHSSPPGDIARLKNCSSYTTRMRFMSVFQDRLHQQLLS